MPVLDGPFLRLGLPERVMMGLIIDRWRMSQGNGDKYRLPTSIGDPDRDSLVYCLYSGQEFALEMGISLRSVRRYMDKLVDETLIHYSRDGWQGSYKIFLYPRVIEWLGIGSVKSAGTSSGASSQGASSLGVIQGPARHNSFNELLQETHKLRQGRL